MTKSTVQRVHLLNLTSADKLRLVRTIIAKGTRALRDGQGIKAAHYLNQAERLFEHLGEYPLPVADLDIDKGVVYLEGWR